MQLSLEPSRRWQGSVSVSVGPMAGKSRALSTPHSALRTPQLVAGSGWRQLEPKPAAFVRFGFDAHFAAHPLDGFFNNA